MALSDLVQEAERYLEDHVGAVKDLVELVPRLEKVISDLEHRPAPAAAPATAAVPATEAATAAVPADTAQPASQEPPPVSEMPWSGQTA